MNKFVFQSGKKKKKKLKFDLKYRSNIIQILFVLTIPEPLLAVSLLLFVKCWIYWDKI